MKRHFIIKAAKAAAPERKEIIEKMYPKIFNPEVQIPITHLKIGKWYRCDNLTYGCQGFNGYGMYVDTVLAEFRGMILSDKAVCLKQIDGQVWNVNGDFYNSTVKEAVKHRDSLLVKEF